MKSIGFFWKTVKNMFSKNSWANSIRGLLKKFTLQKQWLVDRSCFKVLFWINSQISEWNTSHCLTAQKMKFPLRISSVNATKSARNCRKSSKESFIFSAVSAGIYFLIKCLKKRKSKYCIQSCIENSGIRIAFSCCLFS